MTIAQGENAPGFFNLINFPWIPNPLPRLYSPYKKGHFKMEFKMIH